MKKCWQVQFFRVCVFFFLSRSEEERNGMKQKVCRQVVYYGNSKNVSAPRHVGGPDHLTNCLGVETALPEIIDSSLGSTGNTFMFRGKNDFSLAHLQEHKNIMVPRKQNPDKLINKQISSPPELVTSSRPLHCIIFHHHRVFPKRMILMTNPECMPEWAESPVLTRSTLTHRAAKPTTQCHQASNLKIGFLLHRYPLSRLALSVCHGWLSCPPFFFGIFSLFLILLSFLLCFYRADYFTKEYGMNEFMFLMFLLPSAKRCICF